MTIREWVKKIMASIASLALLAGCASQGVDLRQGIIACCYQSSVTPAVGSAPRIPVSLSIAALEREPYEGHTSPRMILSFVPVLSLINAGLPTETVVNLDQASGFRQNANNTEMTKSTDRKHSREKQQAAPANPSPANGKRSTEIEDILRQEIAKSGTVRDVFLAEPGKKADFEIRGSINLIHNAYVHTSGFGIAYVFGLVPFLFLPSSSQEALCEAHLEIVSIPNEKPILSKDYSARVRYADGLLYPGMDKSFRAYGDKLFPEIVEKFISDVRAVPQEAWNRQTAVNTSAVTRSLR